ncbi:MAG: hypothetical protein AVDCRST_MAG30-870 [uncultured Solirubrobacteraceae bacterium]|uniref:Glycosyltransferase subfamily 4-like N-terminal domain-containing protein n=1 Tax=uncultured Solirubrobacteraceae bacterium TaxID=1162706 RepID=A0A6J4RU69_9ACTN|nr:MAG: hypothetical protein AVDCRST_MAG30-870 [uncultured Solirubrobacteraceae bacterium]
MSEAGDLAAGFEAAGHRVERVVAPRALRPLDFRGYEPGAAAVPILARVLKRRAPDLALAQSIAGAAAAARSGHPAVWCVLRPVARAELASRRSRLALLREALAGCALVAADEAVAASIDRWLGARAVVIAPAELPQRVHELA